MVSHIWSSKYKHADSYTCERLFGHIVNLRESTFESIKLNSQFPSTLAYVITEYITPDPRIVMVLDNLAALMNSRDYYPGLSSNRDVLHRSINALGKSGKLIDMCIATRRKTSAPNCKEHELHNIVIAMQRYDIFNYGWVPEFQFNVDIMRLIDNHPTSDGSSVRLTDTGLCELSSDAKDDIHAIIFNMLHDELEKM